MDSDAEPPKEAMPPAPARRPSESPRPSSAINVAMGDAPDLEPPPAQASDDDDDEDDDEGEEESVRGLSTKSGMTAPKGPRESEDPTSGPGSVLSSNEPGAVKVEEGSVDLDLPTVGVSSASGLTVPVQKRRRVTRACDECRRKKIKCDGRSPCTHCSVYSYECTYDKPSNRRRNPAPQYIEALEDKLHRAETLLRKLIPDLDLTDPKLDPAVKQEFATRERARAQATRLAKEDLATTSPSSSSSRPPQKHQQQQPQQQPQQQQRTGTGTGDGSQDAQLMSMIETIGHLDIIDGSEWDFHGVSSGAVFLRRLKEQMGVLGHDSKAPFLPRPPRPPGMFNLDSPRSSAAGSPWEPSGSDVPAIYDLPPKEVTRSLCYYSLNCATCLLRIVHVPSFYEMVDRLYDKGPENLGPEDHRSLALLYSVMALGSMYTTVDDEAATQAHYKTAIEKGVKFYWASRLFLQDITECRDLSSIQALLFLILFLQATSNLSGCYSFLGIALRGALRMGLHRHISHVELTPIEVESRRRVFYVIRQMDIYVSALLGFPLMLDESDIDQPFPTEVNDEYITKDAITPPPPDTPSFFQAMNAHARLMRILSRIIKTIYPVKSMEECAGKEDQTRATYVISYAGIKEIERDLQLWQDQLPNAWRPSSDGPIEVVRVRSLLRFTYAHVQMMLYRPFLHYVSPRLSSGKNVDERYYACAAACVSVSRNIIRIGMEIRKHAALLVGPYWFILYTEFFAIISLTFYALENPGKAGTAEILADANAGREFIASLSKKSLAADRVTDGLNALFEQLPDRVTKAKGQTQQRPIATKKRAAPGSQASPVPIQAQPTPARRSEDSGRPQSGHSGPEQKQPRQIAAQRRAMEAAAQQGHIQGYPGHPGHPGNPFMANFGDQLPADMLVGSGSPDSDVGLFRPAGPAGYHPGLLQQQGSSSSQIYTKLDAMMFPSGDPFEYPSQPLVDLGGGGGGPSGQHHQQQHQQAHRVGAHHHHHQHNQHPEAMQQFYGIPSGAAAAHAMYDDIEGQLLGPIPPYFVQPTSGLAGLDNLAAQMYNASSMLPLQQRHAGAGGGIPHHQHHHNQGPSSAGGGQQQQQTDIDDMLLAGPGFEMFPPHHQYRQL